MDFGTLLHVAKKNSSSDKKTEVSHRSPSQNVFHIYQMHIVSHHYPLIRYTSQIRGDINTRLPLQGSKFYSTKYEAPKKESKDKKLSANIQKFLQKQQEEERERKRIEKQKMEEMLAQRDTKEKNKIRKMLKVTKSANKSVLADAIDTVNTAYTLQGPEQPDEDDYGYVSQEASQLYKKLMDKYKSVPEDDKRFSKSRPQSKHDLSGTKDRVRAAIVKEQEEENGPHRRRRHHDATSSSSAAVKASSSTSGGGSSSATAEHKRKRSNLYDPEAERREEEERRREVQRAKHKARPPPPVLDFHQILLLAEKKQHEPVEIEVEVKKKEPERLLTTKERRELEEREKFHAEREKRKQAQKMGGRIPKLSDGGATEAAAATATLQKMEPNGRIPKLNGTTTAPKPKEKVKSIDKNMDRKTTEQKMFENRKSSSTKTNSSSSSTSTATKPPVAPSRPATQPPPPPSSIKKPLPPSAGTRLPAKDVVRKTPTTNDKPKLPNKAAGSSAPGEASTKRMNDGGKTRPVDAKTRKFPPDDVVKTRQFPPADVQKTRQFPPAAENRGRPSTSTGATRQYPPADVRRGANGARPPLHPSSKRPTNKRQYFPIFFPFYLVLIANFQQDIMLSMTMIANMIRKWMISLMTVPKKVTTLNI